MKRLARLAIAHALTVLPRGILLDKRHAHVYQRAGFHIVRDHFYDPLPNTDTLDAREWDEPKILRGIDKNLDGQLQYLRDAEPYIKEFQSTLWPEGFDGVDGAILYSTIRKFRPQRIIEIGAGRSTLVSLSALNKNSFGSITSIEPYPEPYLTPRDRFTLITNKVERVPISTFESLEANDIVFIDSSHVVKTGGDVIYEILEILPSLKPGAVIHIHDMFFPFDYPLNWLVEDRRFWNEQYLVQAFLAFNDKFKILWSSAMMAHYHREQMTQFFSNLTYSSLWLQRAS